MKEFNFKKKYGQNFLTNEKVANQIVNSINPTSKDLIIEIGPGAGAITKKLQKYDANILAFEIDKDTSKYLNKIENEKTKVVYCDFLTEDITKHINNINYDNLYIIGNLPYYITTPILEKIIDSNLKEKEIIIMVQKEVGERFRAKPHSREYGYMTVLLNYSYQITKIVDVKRYDFNPKPNVDSVVIKLTNKNPDYLKYDELKKLLKEAFQFKRKTINNNLTSRDKEKLRIILEKHDLNLSSRPEDIDLDTYIELSKGL